MIVRSPVVVLLTAEQCAAVAPALQDALAREQRRVRLNGRDMDVTFARTIAEITAAGMEWPPTASKVDAAASARAASQLPSLTGRALSVVEAADRLGVSVRTVRRWAASGAGRKIGRVWLIDERKVMRNGRGS